MTTSPSVTVIPADKNQSPSPNSKPTWKVKSKPGKLIFLTLFILAIISVGAFFFIRSQSTQAPKTNKKISEAVNTVPIADRPYVTLAPTTGKHPPGTEVKITIHNFTLESTKADYELEYQAGSLLQGAFGSVDFTKESPPVSKTLLLGTCSAGGKCDYNKDVSGGTVLLRLSGGQETFAVKGEWSYQLMSDREGKFSSRDSKFRIDVGKKGLSASAYVIVMQTMGLPDEVKGKLVGGPYHVATASNNSLPAEVEMRLSEAVESVTVLGWTGSSWKKYASEVDGKTLTATVDRLTTFIAVSP